eukprot:TRINITY_DN14682_c0_g1_i2.p1 TRINITY_DN14682_c0_g1~~TRINITY_DN14682_c0_g1_i2.p1  ORF type:complete len:723 (+),score=117.68 TRINITY_DN14682_c0_g1_i2:49-2169(+)
MWCVALIIAVALSGSPPVSDSPTSVPTDIPTDVPSNVTDIPDPPSDPPSTNTTNTSLPTSVPTLVPTIIAEEEADYLGVVLGLPASPDDLLDGFSAKAAQKLSEITAVDETLITEGSNSTTPPYNIELKIHSSIATYQVMKDKITQATALGLYIAGVKVESVDFRIRAKEAADECEKSPCGSQQLCVDNNFDVTGDFICSCLDGSHQKVGAMTPSCSAPLSDLSDVSEIMEIVALSNGHTVFAAAYNSLLHSTQCGFAVDDPPLLLHPTRLSVGNSLMAGAVVANTSLVLGCILLQHVLIILLSHYFPDKSVTELRCVTGFPHVCVRVMLSLLPGTIYCSVSLIASGEGEWSVTLGCIIVTIWLLWLVLMTSHGENVQPVHLLSLGQHYPHGMGFKRMLVFRRTFAPWYVGFLVLLCFVIPFRVVSVSGCAAQRYLAGILMLLLLVLTIRLQPYASRYSLILCCLVSLIQSTSWFLLASGLEKADGHRDHPHIDGAVYLRLISAVFILLWMIVSFCYRVPQEFGVPTSEKIASNPFLGIQKMWSELSLFGKVSFTAGDLCWLFVALGIYNYYLFIPAAVLLSIRIISQLKGSTRNKTSTVVASEDSLVDALIPADEETFVVVKDGDKKEGSLHLSPDPRSYSPPEIANVEFGQGRQPVQSQSITARSPSPDSVVDHHTESLEAQRFPKLNTAAFQHSGTRHPQYSS